MKHALLVCLLALAVGCSKSDNNANNPSSNTPNNTVETIGPDGGEVSASGASVSIPADALDDDVEIGVAQLSSSAASDLAATLDANLELVSDLYAFTPHGTSFAQPVDIELPYSSSSDGLVIVRLDDEDDTTWEQVSGATFSSGVASLSANSFSVLGVAAPVSVVANNDAGPNNGNDMGGGGDMGGGVDMGDGDDMGGGDMGMTSNYANLPGTWTITQDLGGTSVGNPAVAVNASGDAIVAWYPGGLVHISERTGGVWTHPADATDGVSFADSADSFGPPFAAIADSGDAALVYDGRVSTGAAIFRSTRTAAGVWTHPVDAADRIDFPTEQNSHFGVGARLDMAPDGGGLTTWNYRTVGIFGSLGTGVAWSQPMDAVNDALNLGGNWSMATGYMAVDITNGGRAIVAHHQDEQNGNFLTMAVRDGANWVRGEQVSLATNRSDYPWAAIAPNGDAVAMFAAQAAWDGCQSCTALYISEYTGGTWTHPADADAFLNAGGPGLNRVTTGETEVALAMTDNGDVVVVYEQFYNNAHEVYVAERINGVWNIPAPDDFIPFTVKSPSPLELASAVSPTGDIVIIRKSEAVGLYRQTDFAHRIDGTWYVPGPNDTAQLSMNGWQWPSISIGANGHVIAAVKANNDTVTIAEFNPN